MLKKIDSTLMQLFEIQRSGTGSFTIPADMAPDLISGKGIIDNEIKLIEKKESLLSASQRKMVKKLHLYIQKTS